MSLPIHVESHSGFKANERPRQFVLDEDVYEIAAVLDQYDEHQDEWTLQSGFDGDELLARPGVELISVDASSIRQVEKQIESCEHCHPDDAEIPCQRLS